MLLSQMPLVVFLPLCVCMEARNKGGCIRDVVKNEYQEEGGFSAKKVGGFPNGQSVQGNFGGWL